MPLTRVERERITDSRLKIQAVANRLNGVDPQKVPDLEETEECLEDADKSLGGALRSSVSHPPKRTAAEVGAAAMSLKGDTPKGERGQLEHALLGEMRTAELAYRQAVAHSQRTAQRFRNLPFGHPDGDRARREAASAEAAELEKYRNAVKAFSDLILHGRPPAPSRQVLRRGAKLLKPDQSPWRRL
jgi:hypothetical protein